MIVFRIVFRFFFVLLVQTVLLALRQIWTNKVRAMLTTLGIIIGVAAVVGTVAAVNGLREYVLKEFETFGAKKVYIDGTLPRSQRMTGNWRAVQLTVAEVNEIRERCPAITRISPHWYGSYTIRHREQEVKGVTVVGIWPEWHDIENRLVTEGRPFNSIDEESRSNVCIVNAKAIEELDLDRNPVGSHLFISGRRFEVVGLIETKELGPMFGGGDVQTEVFIPFGTAQAMNPRGWLNYAVAELASPTLAADVQQEVRFILRKMRGLGPEDEDTFMVEVLQQIIDQFNGVASGITAAAGGIVAISLLVGGIGIMNIMLVSVSERTREIGLRKAVGAKPIVVLTQFLVEAVVLCLAGGLVGLLAAQGLIAGIRAIPDSPLKEAAVPAWAVILAVGFSAATGIIFGMFPAIKAARLNPIDALRHE